LAKRKAPRVGYAKSAGAALIALSLLLGLSLVPQQTAELPHFLAVRAGQGFGAAVVILPALFFLLGLVFLVGETFQLSARLWGVVIAYLVALLALHLRYPAGRELLAAAGGKGGGYAGAILEVALRRALGEPGLWIVTLLAATMSVLLLSGVSVTEALRALLPVLRTTATALAAAAHNLVVWTIAGALAVVRTLGQIFANGARAWMRGLWAGLRWAGTYAQGAPRWVASRARLTLRPAAPSPASAEAAGERDQGSRGVARLAPSRLLGEASAAPDLLDERDAHASLDAPDREDVFADTGQPAGAPRAAPGGVAGAVSARPSGAHMQRKKARVSQGSLGFPTDSARQYAPPDISLLDAVGMGKARSGKVDPEDVARNLEKTLASFGVEARVIRWETGPVVTRYELQPAPGVKVQKITSLQNDIALALAASSVRLEAPIPGKSAIGVELPNERPGLVHLREILGSDEFQSSASPLTVAVGKGIAGTPIVADLVAMPHLLIAGATGAGKSVAINSMIASILFRATPEQVRFLMIDPKRVELTNYNGIPHLLSPVVTGPREAAAKLRWAIQEMESRFELFAHDGVRNIQAFNAQHPDRPLAYIVIIVDELADLMMVAPADFEEIICRLAQMTRATGIHLLVATQRPSVDVITGLIKANIPSRIAFSVTSQVDSRTILDHPGAEKLLGRGDMLFSPIGATRPTRVQGAFIGDVETERLVQFWRGQGEPAYVESLVHAGEGAAPEEASASDALLVDAARLVIRAGYASVSLLQRKMRIGYVRAARVVDQMEEKGIVGPAQGSNPREVLMGLDDLERLLRTGASRAARSPEVALDEAGSRE
jgi:hypothetical protein